MNGRVNKGNSMVPCMSDTLLESKSFVCPEREAILTQLCDVRAFDKLK